MKILIITNSSPGTYMFRRELVEELLKENTVILASPDGLHFDDFEKMGCKTVKTDLDRHGMNIFRELKLKSEYERIIVGEKPDVVLTFTVKPNLYATPICRGENIPCIVNVAGLGTPYEKGGIIKNCFLKIYLSSLKKAAIVFFQNSSVKKVFTDHGLPEDKCFLLPGSGVNTEFFEYRSYPREEEKTVFLLAGRIVKDKGIEEFLCCAKKIKEKYPNTVFEVAGEAESEEYDKTIEKAVSDGVIKFLGFIDDMRPIYENAWAVVVPSYHEGLSNVCLEAAASGRVVIASDIPGCREAVEDGKTGLLFEQKNGDALVKAVEKFLLLPYDNKVEMGVEGRKKVKKEFDRQIVVEEYCEKIKNQLCLF